MANKNPTGGRFNTYAEKLIAAASTGKEMKFYPEDEIDNTGPVYEFTPDGLKNYIEDNDIIDSDEDAARLEIIVPMTSDPDFGYSEFPSDPNFLYAVYGASSATNLTGVRRSAVFGTSILQGNNGSPSLNRVDLFGQGPGRWSPALERVTFMGSLVAQWLGCQPADLATLHHDMWGPEVNTVPPGQVGWDWNGTETRNPGIGAKIAAVTGAVDTSETLGNVGVGRDALCELIKGVYNTSGGYKSLTSLYSGGYNTAWGYAAGRDLILGDRNSYYGYYSGRQLQEGVDNILLGSRAGEDLRRANKNVILGARAISDSDIWQDADGIVAIGYCAGTSVTPTSDSLIIQNEFGRLPLVSGKFDTGKFGINILPYNIQGIFDIRDTSGTPAMQLDSLRRMILNHTSSVTIGGLSPQLQVHGTAASSSTISTIRWSSGAGSSSIYLGKSRGTTQGTQGILSVSDNIGEIKWAGSDGVALIDAARIRAVVDGTPGVNDMPTRLEFAVTPDGTAAVVTQMTLTASSLTSTVPVILPSDPTTALQSATKNYVDKKSSRIIDAHGSASSITGTLTKTLLGTVTIPANSVGPNGVIRITTNWSHTDNANTKTLGIEFDGQTYGSIAAASQIRTHTMTTIYNRNSASSQIGGCNSGNATGFGQSTSNQITSSVDTTVDKDIKFYGTLTNTGDTITLESYLVEVLYHA